MKKVFLAILALTSIGVFAFIPKEKKQSSVQFRYNGTNGSAGYLTSSLWQVGTNLSNCPGSGQVVCIVTPDDQDIDTIEELLLEIQANEFDNMTIVDTKP